MKAQTKLIRLTQQRTAEAMKAAERLKARLLLIFGVLVLCTATIEYSVVKLQLPDGMEIKKISLLLTIFLLPAYFVALFIRNYLAARRQRKILASMVAQLTDDLLKDEAMSTDQRLPRNQGMKGSRGGKTDTLVKKIVQTINA